MFSGKNSSVFSVLLGIAGADSAAQPSTSSVGRLRARGGAYRALSLMMVLFLAATLVACGDDDDNDSPANNNDIAIAGKYESNFDSIETITNESWIMEGEGQSVEFKIERFDNASRLVITQNPEDSDYNPGQFNKTVWTTPDENGSFYYCMVTYGAATADEAFDSDDEADDSDPDNTGCMDYKWTHLSVKSSD